VKTKAILTLLKVFAIVLLMAAINYIQTIGLISAAAKVAAKLTSAS